MSIILTNPEIEPAVVYDRVFMRRLEIEQTQTFDATKVPNYTLYVEYLRFGQLNGKMFYAPGNHEIVIKDYIPIALAKAATGDMDMLQALTAIEMALAKIIEDQDGITTKVV